MEVVIDGAVTGPTLHPPPKCVCVCVQTSMQAFICIFLVSHWDLTTEWHMNGTFSHCSSNGGHVMLMAVVSMRNKMHFPFNFHIQYLRVKWLGVCAQNYTLEISFIKRLNHHIILIFSPARCKTSQRVTFRSDQLVPVRSMKKVRAIKSDDG